MRNALRYVLHNYARHGMRYVDRPDPLSSGPWFEGWTIRDPEAPGPEGPTTAEARTWLQRVGWWTKWGKLHPIG